MMPTPRSLSFLMALLVPGAAFAQGPLNPPGPPAPTMKTLDQVEARVPVNGATTPGDVNAEFIINQPGSYYLTGNLEVTKAQGIRIVAAGVMVDLNGFQIRTAVSSGEGISIEATANRCTVTNGSLVGFGFGINNPEDAVDSTLARGGSFARLSFSGCTIMGLRGGEGSGIEDCEAQGNPGLGISAALGSTIKNSTVVRNDGSGIVAAGGATIVGCSAGINGGIGIMAGDGTTVSDCSAYANRAGGISAGPGSTINNCTSKDNLGYGFQVGFGSSMTSSTARGNQTHGVFADEDTRITDCILASNGGNGILALDRSSVSRCTASFNGTGGSGSGVAGSDHVSVKDSTAIRNRLNGISVGGDSVVTGNHVSLNGQGAAAAGIRTTGSGSRIDGNHTRDNIGTGILADPNDVVVRNTAGNNSAANYNPAAGPNFGPLQQPTSATNPMANVVF